MGRWKREPGLTTLPASQARNSCAEHCRRSSSPSIPQHLSEKQGRERGLTELIAERLKEYRKNPQRRTAPAVIEPPPAEPEAEPLDVEGAP
jgi:hypothetical protein